MFVRQAFGFFRKMRINGFDLKNDKVDNSTIYKW